MKKKTLFAIFAFLVSAVLPFGAKAEESAFIKDFTASYKAMKSDRAAALVRQYKSAIPAEVEFLINEAASKDKIYFEKMELLDVANALAAMNIEWNAGDPGLLMKVEDI